jgi:hypothetical protein
LQDLWFGTIQLQGSYQQKNKWLYEAYEAYVAEKHCRRRSHLAVSVKRTLPSDHYWRPTLHRNSNGLTTWWLDIKIAEGWHPTDRAACGMWTATNIVDEASAGRIALSGRLAQSPPARRACLACHMGACHPGLATLRPPRAYAVTQWCSTHTTVQCGVLAAQHNAGFKPRLTCCRSVSPTAPSRFRPPRRPRRGDAQSAGC